MPRYYEDKLEGGACAGVKEDLGACLLQSACVLQVARPGRELRGHWLPAGLQGAHVRGGGRSHSSRFRTDLCSAQPQEGKSPRQCLKEGHCRALQYSFFECKRSMLDTRSRFRGRKGY